VIQDYQDLSNSRQVKVNSTASELVTIVSFNDQLIVLIVAVDHRKDVYRDF
jgi:hypothetical protein